MKMNSEKRVKLIWRLSLLTAGLIVAFLVIYYSVHLVATDAFPIFVILVFGMSLGLGIEMGFGLVVFGLLFGLTLGFGTESFVLKLAFVMLIEMTFCLGVGLGHLIKVFINKNFWQKAIDWLLAR